MIGWAAGGMAAVGALGGIFGGMAENDAVAAQNAIIAANIKQNTLEANYMVAEATRQQQEVMDQAANELITLQIQQMDAEGAVDAAAAETGVEGKSMNSVKRSVMADYGRSASSIMENVDRELMALHSQKESVVKMANQRSSNMALGYKKGRSTAETLLKGVTGGIQGYTSAVDLLNSMDKYDFLINKKRKGG